MNINRIPRGLLAYLDSQTQGENPSGLGEVVAPVLDLERFYRANARYETASGGSSFDVLNANVTQQYQQEKRGTLTSFTDVAKTAPAALPQSVFL